jgi:hypothetical protein
VRLRLPGLCLAATLVGCSKLPTTGDGIVAIEVTVPGSLNLYKDSTITLHAKAFDQQGNEVAAAVRWFTVDTAAVTVDSVLGTVTARTAGTTARIQASVGTLHSTPLVLILLLPPVTPGLVQPQEH